MKKLLTIMFAALAVIACSTDDQYDINYFTQKYKQTEKPVEEDTTKVPEPDTLYVSITYNGTTAALSGDVDKVIIDQKGADVTLTSDTEKYLQLTLSGTSTNGSLLVYSLKPWGLVLNGIQLTNADGPAINNQCSKWLYVTLTDGTENISFKTSGKEILEAGWRDVYATSSSNNATPVQNPVEEEKDNKKEQVEERILPTFTKGESGPHTPTLTEKWTTPPPYYTEATLLRAMETAGKFVEDEELRAALKENGIGRPSSRAGIIETLFKRHYIKRERKRLVATPTGIELIDIIKEELLKSCELTGIWEKKLRDIEHQKYDATQFINELKQQITDIVYQVMADNGKRINING